MSTHAKGPWQQHDCVVMQGSRLVADCTPSYNDGQANARLVACAPDLLDALKNLVSQVDENSWIRDELADARVAIAKAEGKS